MGQSPEQSTQAQPTFKLEFEDIESTQLSGAIAVVPWDTALFNKRVAELKNFTLTPPNQENCTDLTLALQKRGVEICCARLADYQMLERLALQNCGFRFIEISYGLIFPRLSGYKMKLKECSLRPANIADLPALEEIAGSVFTHERFFTDFRIGPALSHKRYQHWISSSLENPKHEVLVQESNGSVNGFFVSEQLPDGTVLLQLGAVRSELQGSGLGVLLWHSVISHYQKEGAVRGRTKVSSNNLAILRLWLSLGFQIESSEHIFHWVKDAYTPTL